MKTASIVENHPKANPEIPGRNRVCHEEMFKLAFQGLCAGAQFYSRAEGGLTFYFDSKDELKLLKHLAYLAYNAASYACGIYNQQEELTNFTDKA